MLALGDYVIVKPTATQTTTPGGIILPDSAQAKAASGEIVSVGSEVYLFGSRRAEGAPSKAVGCTVMFARGRGVTVENEGQSYLVLKDSELLAIL